MKWSSLSSTSRPHRAHRGPDGRRHLWHELEQPPGAIDILAEEARALDGRGEVRDGAVTPPADLVAEEPQPSGCASPDRTLGDDSAFGGGDPGRCLLDHEASLRDVDLQRRVVEVKAVSVVEHCRDHLEDLAVQSHGMAPGSEWQPIQVDTGGTTHRPIVDLHRGRSIGSSTDRACGKAESRSGEAPDSLSPPAHATVLDWRSRCVPSGKEKAMSTLAPHRIAAQRANTPLARRARLAAIRCRAARRHRRRNAADGAAGATAQPPCRPRRVGDGRGAARVGSCRDRHDRILGTGQVVLLGVFLVGPTLFLLTIGWRATVTRHTPVEVSR